MSIGSNPRLLSDDALKRIMLNLPFFVLIKDKNDDTAWMNSRAQKLNGHLSSYLDVVKEEDDDERVLDGVAILDNKAYVKIDGEQHQVRIDKIPFLSKERNVEGILIFILDYNLSESDTIQRYENEVSWYSERNTLLLMPYLNLSLQDEPEPQEVSAI